jgi:hypothetical protein
MLKDHMITQLLRRPSAIDLDTQAIQKYLTASQKLDREEDMQMWCLCHEFDGVAAFMRLILALLLAVVLGVAIEMIIRDIEQHWYWSARGADHHTWRYYGRINVMNYVLPITDRRLRRGKPIHNAYQATTLAMNTISVI